MDNKLFVTTEDGQELEMEILFTFDSEEFGKSYVYFFNPEDEEGEVGVMSYDEEGNLENITDEKEWDMIEEVFDTFMDEINGADEEHHHEEGEECGCGCGHHHHEDGECHCEDDCEPEDHEEKEG